ncbi:hypothetical protein PCE1_002699 [Barthelona sp. PCE]
MLHSCDFTLSFDNSGANVKKYKRFDNSLVQRCWNQKSSQKIQHLYFDHMNSPIINKEFEFDQCLDEASTIEELYSRSTRKFINSFLYNTNRTQIIFINKLFENNALYNILECIIPDIRVFSGTTGEKISLSLMDITENDVVDAIFPESIDLKAFGFIDVLELHNLSLFSKFFKSTNHKIVKIDIRENANTITRSIILCDFSLKNRLKESATHIFSLLVNNKIAFRQNPLGAFLGPHLKDSDVLMHTFIPSIDCFSEEALHLVSHIANLRRNIGNPKIHDEVEHRALDLSCLHSDVEGMWTESQFPPNTIFATFEFPHPPLRKPYDDSRRPPTPIEKEQNWAQTLRKVDSVQQESPVWISPIFDKRRVEVKKSMKTRTLTFKKSEF